MPSRRTKRTKRKPVKTSKRTRRERTTQPSIMGTLGKGVVAALKTALPGMIRAVMPFPTSGAYAMASPGLATDTAVSAPAANGTIVRTSKAIIDNNNDGITVRHREFLQDISPSTDGFQMLVAQAINPSNSSLFPWLSGIVNRYECFKFHTLKFIYEPQCSTTTSGTVMMAVDYDVDDSEPTSKVQMMSFKGAARSPPWFAGTNMSASSDLNRQKSYYITQKIGSESRLSNVGNFFLAYEGTEQLTMGELYVEYEVRLSIPTLEGETGLAATFFSAGDYGSSGTHPIWTNFGSPSTTNSLGNLPVTTMNVSSTNYVTSMGFTIPSPATYLLTGVFAVTSVNVSGDVNPTFTGTSEVTFATNFSETTYSESDVNSESNFFIAFQTNSTDQLVTLSFTSTTNSLAAATVGFLIHLVQIPNACLVPTFLSEPTLGFKSRALREARLRNKWKSESDQFKTTSAIIKAPREYSGKKELQQTQGLARETRKSSLL